MASPVWVLSVDLQTKTATFQTGMADAAKAARSAFNDIKSSAQEGGETVHKSSVSAQQALGVLSNTIRGDVENALIDLVHELSNTSVVMAALPIAAAVGGLGLLVNIVVELAAKYKELREEEEKLNNDATRFGTTVNESLRNLDDKLLQAGQRADELRNDHLGALRKELELINHASMDELVKSFDVIAKAADGVFKNLEGNWYTWGIGSEGAKHALQQFQLQYESLLSQGKDKDASDLLAGTRQSAQHILDMQRQAQAANVQRGALGVTGDEWKLAVAKLELEKAGVGHTEKEVRAQESLVDALNAQYEAQGKIEALKKVEGSNVTRQTGNDASARASEAAKQAVASQLAMGEQAIAADRAQASAQLEIQHATVQQRLDNALDFSERERDIKLAANQQEIAALDKSGKDYINQLKALNDKSLEITTQYTSEVTQLRSHALVEQNRKDLQDYEQGERDKIAATMEGSGERLAIIDAALTAAQERSLQDTDYYRQLASQRVETVRQMTETESKLRSDAAREAAEHERKMGELAVAAEVEAEEQRNAVRRMSDAELLLFALATEDKLFAMKRSFIQQEIAALDKSGKDYENKLKALQNREIELLRQHENQRTSIGQKAAAERLQKETSAMASMETTFALSFQRVLAGQMSFAAMMGRSADQMVSNLIAAAIAMANHRTTEKLDEAKDAARQGFLWGSKYGGPLAPVLAPTMAATFFAGVMAFADGGVVPGVALGDTVPAMLTPGEGVVPKGVMDGLSNLVRNGGFDRPSAVNHVRVSPTFHIQTIDAEGMRGALEKHTEVLQKHMENALRKLNR